MTLHNIQCQIFKIFFFYLTVKLPIDGERCADALNVYLSENQRL